MIFSSFFGKNNIRRKLLKHTHSQVMREYLQTPFPSNKQLLNDVNIVSLDFETTGLDIHKDRVVSFGLVNIIELGVDLSSSCHQLVKPNQSIPESSIVIHQLTDNQLENGSDLDLVLPELLKKLSGKVMLAHNAKVELGFINTMCQKLYDTDFVIPVIDTQYLARRSLERQNQAYKSNDLRLFNLRKSLNMPSYKAHNALMDAVATAELFLAMVSKISPKYDARLSDFLS